MQNSWDRSALIQLRYTVDRDHHHLHNQTQHRPVSLFMATNTWSSTEQIPSDHDWWLTLYIMSTIKTGHEHGACSELQNLLTGPKRTELFYKNTVNPQNKSLSWNTEDSQDSTGPTLSAPSCPPSFGLVLLGRVSRVAAVWVWLIPKKWLAGAPDPTCSSKDLWKKIHTGQCVCDVIRHTVSWRGEL